MDTSTDIRKREVHDAPPHDRATCILHVCTSCRGAGVAREPKENRPGFILFERLQAAFETSPLASQVRVCSAECLSICPRPCGVALSSHGAWTYLFGDQSPTDTAQDIVECVAAYIESRNGFMPRASRPKSLQRSILGRVPPRGEV